MQNELLIQAIEKLLNFNSENDLTSRIAQIENDLVNQQSNFVVRYLSKNQLEPDVLESALVVKKSLGQINVIIHALGIVNLLEQILDEDEVIQELSIGAGSTNRPFDLVTNKRIAEFKFINWSGKQDAIRQNNVFKDFFELEVYKTDKKKYLYVLDKDIVLKFLNNNRSLESVLSKNEIRNKFYEVYGNRYSTVSDYYKENSQKVEIVEIRDLDENLFPRLTESKVNGEPPVIQKEQGQLQKDIISEFIQSSIKEAKEKGMSYIDIKAGDVGKCTGFKKSFPNICRIMKKLKQEKDIVLNDTPSGMGSTVTIRYFV